LPNTSIDGAIFVANKIKDDIATIGIIVSNKKTIHMTASFGISHIDCKDESTVEPALIRADKALYKAKDTGRNRVCT